jgi:hypothetical protein
MIDFSFFRFNKKGSKGYSPVVDQESALSPAEPKIFHKAEPPRPFDVPCNEPRIPWMLLTFIFAGLSGLVLVHDLRRSGRYSFEAGYHDEMG